MQEQRRVDESTPQYATVASVGLVFKKGLGVVGKMGRLLSVAAGQEPKAAVAAHTNLLASATRTVLE